MGYFCAQRSRRRGKLSRPAVECYVFDQMSPTLSPKNSQFGDIFEDTRSLAGQDEQAGMRAYLQISSKFCFRDEATWMDDVVAQGLPLRAARLHMTTTAR